MIATRVWRRNQDSRAGVRIWPTARNLPSWPRNDLSIETPPERGWRGRLSARVESSQCQNPPSSTLGACRGSPGLEPCRRRRRGPGVLRQGGAHEPRPVIALRQVDREDRLVFLCNGLTFRCNTQHPQNRVRLRPIRIRFITRKTGQSGIRWSLSPRYETRPRHPCPSDTPDGLNGPLFTDLINPHPTLAHCNIQVPSHFLSPP